MIGESILELHETNATGESITSYEYDEYQPITRTQLNSAGQITITIMNQDQFLHFFMHFYPRTMTTHAESINSDLQRGVDRHLRHTQH